MNKSEKAGRDWTDETDIDLLHGNILKNFSDRAGGADRWRPPWLQTALQPDGHGVDRHGGERRWRPWARRVCTTWLLNGGGHGQMGSQVAWPSPYGMLRSKVDEAVELQPGRGPAGNRHGLVLRSAGQHVRLAAVGKDFSI